MTNVDADFLHGIRQILIRLCKKIPPIQIKKSPKLILTKCFISWLKTHLLLLKDVFNKQSELGINSVHLFADLFLGRSIKDTTDAVMSAWYLDLHHIDRKRRLNKALKQKDDVSFKLWSFSFYVATSQQCLHTEYVYLSCFDPRLVFLIMISLIKGWCSQESVLKQRFQVMKLKYPFENSIEFGDRSEISILLMLCYWNKAYDLLN